MSSTVYAWRSEQLIPFPHPGTTVLTTKEINWIEDIRVKNPLFGDDVPPHLVRKAVSGFSKNFFYVPQTKDVYVLLKQIGIGGAKTAFLAEHIPGNQQCAITLADNREALKREGDFYKKVRGSTFIIQVYAVITTPSRIVFAMPYCFEGDLHSLIMQLDNDPTRISFAQKCLIGCQAAQGVRELHERGIIHRDIKPENFFLTDRVQLADLGSACNTENDPSQKEHVGTLQFMAPEVLRAESENRDIAQVISPKVDVWGLGITLYALFTVSTHADLPWLMIESEDEVVLPTEMRQKILSLGDNWSPDTSFSVTSHPEADKVLKNTLAGMLKVNPEQRFTSQGVAEGFVALYELVREKKEKKERKGSNE